MEMQKATFMCPKETWKKFLEIAKFRKDTNGSAMLRGYVKETVETEERSKVE